MAFSTATLGERTRAAPLAAGSTRVSPQPDDRQDHLGLFPSKRILRSFPSGAGLALSLGAIVYHPQDVGKGLCEVGPRALVLTLPMADSCRLCGSDPEVRALPGPSRGHPDSSPGTILCSSHSLSYARTIPLSHRVSGSTPSRLSQASSASSGVTALTAGPGGSAASAGAV